MKTGKGTITEKDIVPGALLYIDYKLTLFTLGDDANLVGPEHLGDIPKKHLFMCIGEHRQKSDIGNRKVLVVGSYRCGWIWSTWLVGYGERVA